MHTLDAKSGRNSRRVPLRIFVVVILTTLPVMLFGQAYFGTVSGILTDPTGAVVQGAKVTLTDQEKGYKFNATSDTTGRYLFRSIPPGLYSVTVEMAGFEKVVHTNVRVSINDNATANVTLKVASTTQSVEVQAQTQTIATEDATTGQVINRNFIANLPNVGRQVMDLTYLTAGVTYADDQCKGCGGTNFISNGTRNATADILMDGASVTNFEPNGGVTEAAYTPSPEAVDEFKVQQSNFSAEYGFSGASIVNMVTRSGSNSFHGSVYDYFRSDKLNANEWYANYQGDPRQPAQRNNYGGAIGGPILKSKTFFFFDWDGVRQTSQSTYNAGVPTDLMMNGDFSEVCSYYGGAFDSTGLCSVAQGQIWDPFSGVYDPETGGPSRSTFVPYNNVGMYISPGSPNPQLPGEFQPPSGIPGNLIDPVGYKMMQLLPRPSTNMTSPTIYHNWHATGTSAYRNDQFDIKIDHRFSEKHMLSAKYARQWSHSDPFNCFGNFTDPCGAGSNKGAINLFAINDTYTFSPTFLMAATFGFTRGSMQIFSYNTKGIDPLNNNVKVADPIAELGLPSYLKAEGFPGVPTMYINGDYWQANGRSLGSDPWGNYKQGKNTGQLSILFNKMSGSQEMKFGFEGRMHQMNYLQTNSPVGDFSFDQSGTSQCVGLGNDVCGGDAMASFMMGMACQWCGEYEIQIEPATTDFQFATFFQDNWKANSKLTLNLGIRYDASVPRTERFNRQNWLDLTAPSPLSGVMSLGTLYGAEHFASSRERRVVNMDWKDFQPRIGFAFQFAPNTVVRGGYGIYFSQPRSGASGVTPYTAQGYNVWTNISGTFQDDGATPYARTSNPFPDGLTLPQGNTLGAWNDIGFAGVGPTRTMTNTPYEQSWSFGFERQMPWKIIASAEYVGKKGTHLYYAGANSVNHLGPQIENYTPAQIEDLLTYVDNPFAGYITDPNSSLYYDQVQKYQLQLPYPQYTGVSTEVPPIGSSIYHGLQLKAEKAYSNGLQFLVTYVWSKSIDDASANDDNTTWLGSFISIVDPNKLYLERSLSTFDIPHVVQFSYTYDLPVGRGKAFGGSMRRGWNAVLGGWKTSGIWRIASGRPLSFGIADGKALPTYGQRPDMAAKPRRNYSKGWNFNYFANPEALQRPADYTIGTAPRTIGSVRTPRQFSSDLALAKDFSLARVREGMRLEFRIEAQNAFNHPVFGDPNTSVDSESFGQIWYTSIGARQAQASLKLSF